MDRQYLVRHDQPLAADDMQYTLMVCLVLRGAKRADVGGRAEVVRRGQVFLSLVDVPVTASIEAPYRSVAVVLDEEVVASWLPDVDPGWQPGTGAFHTAPADTGLVGAFERWVALLDEPQHIPALARRTEEEITYRLLTGELGGALRSGLSIGPVAQVRRATRYLTERTARAVSVQDLAEEARMSVPSLHRHFKAVTGLTPVQFHRRLRLQKARQLLVAGAHSAAAAAHAVGYASASQFSRDYTRHYGSPPARDAARLRALAPPSSAVSGSGNEPRRLPHDIAATRS
ncbi:MAG: AraC family transcriptional regulator N-terminal domain-containing protein [Kineosporiaceae bacterium]